MPLSAEDAKVTVEDLVHKLNLPESRNDVKHSASATTLNDAKNAGFRQNLKSWPEPASQLDRPEFLVGNIVHRLKKHYDLMTRIEETTKKIRMRIVQINDGYDPQRYGIQRWSALIDALNAVWIEHVVNNLDSELSKTCEVERVDDREGGRKSQRRQRLAADEDKYSLTLDTIHESYLSGGDSDGEDAVYRERTTHFEAWYTIASMTTESDILSEHTVEQVIGGKVRSTFLIPNCVVKSDIKVSSIDALRMAKGKDPRPDFAAVMENSPYLEGLPKEFCPVLGIGEAKMEATGEGRTETMKSRSYKSQQASVAYPTLIEMAVIHALPQPIEQPTVDDIMNATIDSKPLKPFPEEYMIYGVYLDQKQLRIRVHFPFFDPEESGVRFCQIEMTDLTVPFYGEDRSVYSHREKENAPLRLRMIRTLLIIRKHLVQMVEAIEGPELGKWRLFSQIAGFPIRTDDSDMPDISGLRIR